MYVLTQAALCNNFSANAGVLNIAKEETFTDMNDSSLHLLEQLSLASLLSLSCVLKASKTRNN